MRRTLAALLLLVGAAAPSLAKEVTLELADGSAVRYELVEQPSPGVPSARPTAHKVLAHLAAGEIEEAAVLSNTPKRRFEVLRDYLASVGEAEFKRVFAEYLQPNNRLLAEVAIGPRRLLIWDLAEAGNHLAAQYYVEVDGRFLMDDVPSEERMQLRRVLEAYRAGKAPP